jgi:hypothetical protein
MLATRVTIGVAQALALVPGTSRSGIMITAALFSGLDRATAARYSFLLGIPITAAAGGYKLMQVQHREVIEDRANGDRILNGTEQAEASPATRAGQHIEIESAAHQIRPRPVTRRRRGRRVVGRIILGIRSRRRRPGEGAVGHRPGAPARVRREHAVVEDQVDARARGEGGELFEELHRREEQMARAVRPGRLQREQDAVVAHASQPLLRDARAQ